MPVKYEITPSGARSRSAEDLLADKHVRSEMRKTFAAFDAITKKQDVERDLQTKTISGKETKLSA